jgi:hypothetical protein
MSPSCSASRNGSWRSTYNWLHSVVMLATLASMLVVTFYTVSGAYERRPCTYKEDPRCDACGSLWSPRTTFVYTALSRTVWSIGVSVIIYLSIGRGTSGGLVSSILSCRCWSALSHLSFGAYLIHPIVIFVWQLGDREKQVFRLLSFAMDYISVCVVSYVAALLAAVFVELPCAALLKNLTFHATHWRQRCK